jgi:hypothetical protein
LPPCSAVKRRRSLNGSSVFRCRSASR